MNESEKKSKMKRLILFLLNGFLPPIHSADTKQCSTRSNQKAPSEFVSDADCTRETILEMNKDMLPILDNLVKTTVFRYYRVDLNKPCQFWNEDMLCVLEDCSVSEAKRNEIPEDWLPAELSSINWGISKSQGFKMVKKCEFKDKDFCQIEDEFSQDGFYVNLVKNPERYTGYAGESAARVWAAIYNENCFELPSSSPLSDSIVCTEKRVFYRLISGLHSSISIHICNEWLNRTTSEWVMNLDCYKNRIYDYPERLENLHFLWAVVLRSISKLSPYLQNYPFCHGTDDESLVKEYVDSAVRTTMKYPPTFDETKLFNDEYSKLKKEFKEHFRNISLIMDCVGCEKCRLWGKLQITGLGTALKILFSYQNPTQVRLSRSELVALMNVFHRLSESVEASRVMHTIVGDRERMAEWIKESVLSFAPQYVWMFYVGLTIMAVGVIKTIYTAFNKYQLELSKKRTKKSKAQ